MMWKRECPGSDAAASGRARSKEETVSVTKRKTMTAVVNRVGSPADRRAAAAACIPIANGIIGGCIKNKGYLRGKKQDCGTVRWGSTTLYSPTQHRSRNGHYSFEFVRAGEIL